MAENKDPQEEDFDKPTYLKSFYCGNCEKHFTKCFKFGKVAHKGTCPKCGVSDAMMKGDRFRSDY